MAFCTNCGTKIADGSNFCGNCGTRVNSAPQQQENNSTPAARAQQAGTQKRMANFTPIEATVCAYIGSKSEKAFKFGSLGRNDGVSLLDWIEKYSDSRNGKGVHLYLYHPDEDNLCKLASIVVDNDDEFVAGCEWGMDYNDDKPIDILFGSETDAERTEFDDHDCMHRYIPFV